MKRLCFVRHTESVSNAGGVTMEHAVIPLSPFGIEQAIALAELLDGKSSRVLMSSYARAMATALPYCERVGLQAQVHPLLHEFSALDPDRLAGMTGKERRPLADAYWAAGDLEIRMGPKAETFREFADRVDGFISELPDLPDRCVLFGHGIWLGLLFWKLLGFTTDDAQDMRAFRRFQSGLPMPNGAVYWLEGPYNERWIVQADERVMKSLAKMPAPSAPI